MFNKKNLLILTILLLIISVLTIIINGNTLTYERQVMINNADINKMVLKIQNEGIVEVLDYKYENNILTIKMKSIKKGRTYYSFYNPDDDTAYLSDTIYVNSLGVITVNEYFGKSSGDIVIPISTFIIVLFITIMFIKKYRESIKDNIYKYKNVFYVGVITFLIITTMGCAMQIFSYNGLATSIRNLIASVHGVSIYLFPVAVVLSIFVIINSIELVIKEGFSFKNMLGVLLGVILIILTLLPDRLYLFLMESGKIDIFNERGIGLYIYNFIETFIYVLVSYLECVLVGTIVLGIKSAKHIPKYDKDYIIILGCMIKKDGTLTNLLKGRVDMAIEFSKLQKENTNKDIIFIPSGGQGSDEVISEGVAMKNYLLKQGIKEKNILVEDKSKNTYENLKFSYNLIKEKNKDANIALSTTNYHVFRAGILATTQGIKVEGIGSKTRTYFWLNAFIREYIATLVSEKKYHVIMILVILLICIVLIYLDYLSKIL